VSPADERVDGPGKESLDLSKLPLAKLREHVARLATEDEAERLARALQGDARVGARALGDRTLRKIEAERADRRRIAALFEGRARLLLQGCRIVAGVDEVGVGPLAGPVVAAAVALPEKVELPGLNDSKKVSASDRERLATAIREQALGVAIGEVSALEIDRMNIFRAGLEAMRRAAAALADRLELDHLMVDARTIPDLVIPQTSLIRGDSIDGSIAAASIVAKVYRDGIMQKLEVEYPGYGFGRNMGYGTAEHVGALGRLGASPAHRQSFAPVAATLGR
jgi:ribonuclease HII